MAEEDPELLAMRDATKLIESLPPEARARVAAYLAHRYGVESSGVPPPASVPAAAPGAKAPLPSSGPTRHVALGRFAERHAIPLHRVDEVIDFDSRDVHKLSPWKGVVEQTCRLAGMLSLCQVAVDGTFTIAQKDLARAARRHAIYDPDSTSTYLRRFRYDGSVVFARDKAGEPWRITPTGQNFVAESVKQALGIAPAEKTEKASAIRSAAG
jgi:hypothetical protein